MSNDAPIYVTSKIEKWGARRGTVRTDSSGREIRHIKVSQWGTGSSNSGPQGHRAKRWYADSFGVPSGKGYVNGDRKQGKLPTR